MDLSRSTMKKILILIAFAAACLAISFRLDAVVAALRVLLSILSPFLVGSAIAFVLNVPMRCIEDKLFSSPKVQRRLSQSLRRGISLVITIASVAALIALLILVVVPQLVKTVAGLGSTIQDFITRLVTWVESSNPELLAQLNSLTIDWSSINWENIAQNIINFIKTGATDVLLSTISMAKGLVNGIATFLIAFVFSCYLLVQKEKLSLQIRKVFFALLSKKHAEQIIKVSDLSQRIFSSFITGQCLEAVILGLMFFVVMMVLNMPYALLISCLITVTALIPIVGAFIGCAVGAFLILMVSPTQALLFVIIFLILQQIEGNLIYPHVVGNSVGLPSIWVLAAVSIGGSIMGIFGMLVFIPLVSVVYTLFREYIYKKLDEKHIKVK